MSTNNQTKTALRAALHQEDAALQERLPAAAAAAPARPPGSRAQSLSAPRPPP
ncbi:MAG TPA: hypothetical protein PL143_02310 [Rhodocyclaceae bacterium]|nr:hypothetical protein [Rhodocyclaceae bacterium]